MRYQSRTLIYLPEHIYTDCEATPKCRLSVFRAHIYVYTVHNLYMYNAEEEVNRLCKQFPAQWCTVLNVINVSYPLEDIAFKFENVS